MPESVAVATQKRNARRSLCKRPRASGNFLLKLYFVPAAVSHKESDNAVKSVAGVNIVSNCIKIATDIHSWGIRTRARNYVTAKRVKKKHTVEGKRAATKHRHIALYGIILKHIGQHGRRLTVQHHTHGTASALIINKRHHRMAEILLIKEWLGH